MLIERNLNNGLILRKSDSGMYIRNKVTGELYIEATDLINEERAKYGLVPFEYEETDKAIEETESEVG